MNHATRGPEEADWRGTMCKMRKDFVKKCKRCVNMCEIALKRKEILTFLAWAGMMPKDNNI